MKKLFATLLACCSAWSAPVVDAGWHYGGCFNCANPRGSTQSFRCFEALEDGETGQARCYDEEGVIEIWDCFTEGTACMNVIATGGGGTSGGGGGSGGGSTCTVTAGGWCPATCFSCRRILF